MTKPLSEKDKIRHAYKTDERLIESLKVISKIILRTHEKEHRERCGGRLNKDREEFICSCFGDDGCTCIEDYFEDNCQNCKNRSLNW